MACTGRKQAMPYARWTVAMDRIIWTSYYAGNTVIEIALVLDRSEAAIVSRLRVLKAVGGPRPEDEMPAPTLRKCLCCLRPFQSEGWHNRLCHSCKNGAAFS